MNTNTTNSTQPDHTIHTLTNELLEDLFNPSITTLDLCKLHALTLLELAAILESQTYTQAVESSHRINTARRDPPQRRQHAAHRQFQPQEVPPADTADARSPNPIPEPTGPIPQAADITVCTPIKEAIQRIPLGEMGEVSHNDAEGHHSAPNTLSTIPSDDQQDIIEYDTQIMTNITVSETINAPAHRVFAIASDIPNAAGTITGIESIETLSEAPPAPNNNGVVGKGYAWRETRIMFGKKATEDMTIIDWSPPQSYTVEAHSHGSHYVTDISVEQLDEHSSRISMSFSATPQTFTAKIMMKIFALMTKKLTQCLADDLRDIKVAAEAN